MSASTLCAKCGADLPTRSPEGLCPKCMFARGLELLGNIDASTPREDVSLPTAPFTGMKIRYFGDYELLEEIARGGMGVVYKAKQRSLNRIVALKLLPGGFAANDVLIRRFQTEAEAVAQLDHPNIVSIFEVGSEKGQYYFTMRLIQGESLAQRLLRGRVSEKAAAALMSTVARAIHYAHQHGVLHRDLKPANILVDQAGTPFIVDFGLAKRIDAPSADSHTLAIIGTLNYMSPEQADGRFKHLTTASDVYSLGVILYELLTGKVPFEGESHLALLRHIAETAAPPLRIHDAELDPRIEAICLHCLQKNPDDRYPSAQALASDLDAFLNGSPVSVISPIGATFRESSWNEPSFAREYRETADLIIPERRYLLRIMRSFFTRFIGLKRSARVCDLGCGDGILLEELLSIDQSLKVTLVDGSGEMLQAAKTRLRRINAKIDYVGATFSDLITDSACLPEFDFVVSGFAIHHVPDAEKWALFRRILEKLSLGGWFMNIEGVLPDDHGYADWQFGLWREWVVENENLSRTGPSLSGIVDLALKDPDNRFTQLTTQLRVLSGIGFQKVECHYRNGIFALYTAQKQNMSVIEDLH